MSLQLILVVGLIIYQAIATFLENRKAPPGQRYDIGGYCLHLHCQGESGPVVIIDSSLGGLEGYLLQDSLSQFSRVCIYDRAGYGWSDHSPHARTSTQVVQELDQLLQQAQIAPPYILVGNSFGSYNMRLYAHRYPNKVMGLVLTDGLHESGMLNMPMSLQFLKLFFISGFVMSVLGTSLGIVRLLATFRVFELLKPELKAFSSFTLTPIKRSFCRPKHWLTMSREMVNLEKSGRQLRVAQHLGNLAMFSIKSASFFTPKIWTALVPLRTANRLRNEMHQELLRLSTNCEQIDAIRSSHFVWIDQPDLLVGAVKQLVEQDTSPVHS